MIKGAGELEVRGVVHGSRSEDMLILETRLDGRDTFLSGTLDMSGETFPVRIYTLDDVTVLRLGRTIRAVPGAEWSGTLHLPHGSRPLSPPLELVTLAHERDRDLAALDEAELRYALTYLGESTSGIIWEARANLIVDALPALTVTLAHRARKLISLDVGGTLGTSAAPSLAKSLVSRSPLSAGDAYRILRTSLHIAPEVTPGVIREVCQELGISPPVAPPLSTPAPLVPLPGSLEVIRQLAFQGTVVTLSNVLASESDLPQLLSLFSPWLVAGFRSCDLGVCKPDPRAFTLVAERMGFAIGDVVHVGDDWACDAEGAAAAGATAVWIASGRDAPSTKDPDIRQRITVVQNLDEVPGAIEGLAKGA